MPGDRLPQVTRPLVARWIAITAGVGVVWFVILSADALLLDSPGAGGFRLSVGEGVLAVLTAVGLLMVFVMGRRLGRQQEFYQLIFDNFPAQIAVYDENLRYLYVNPASVRDPVKRKSLIGRTSVDYWRGHKSNEPSAQLRYETAKRCLDTGEITSLEEPLVTRDGETRYYLRMFNPVLDSAGRVTRIIGYGLDVTDRRRAENELAAKEEMLRQAQKMEAVGRLAGGVAHDFNNLLTVIAGYTDILLGRGSVGLRERSELLQVKQSAERASALTRQLLAFSRKQVLQPRTLDLVKVLGSMQDMLERLIGEDIALVADYDPEPLMVRADPGQVEQAIVNLAMNARDAMPGGGVLAIRLYKEQLDPAGAAVRGLSEDGQYVVMEVADSGVGMDEETRRHIFEPFFTTKGVGRGTGLGLSMVYGFIKQSGGSIDVKSTPGQGTVVRLHLPREMGTTAGRQPGEGKTTWAELTTGGETILLVEDAEGVRKLARRLLTECGYRVLTAANPHEALVLSENHEDPIHLVLTDVIMPGMSGKDLADRVLAGRPQTKILYMSGYTGDVLADRGVLAAGTELLQKPFTPSTLASRVREVLDGAPA